MLFHSSTFLFFIPKFACVFFQQASWSTSLWFCYFQYAAFYLVPATGLCFYRCVRAGAFGNMCINNRVKSACISMVIHSQILNRVQIQGEGNHLHYVQKWSLPDDTIWETEKRKKINVLVWVRQNYGNISLIRTHSGKYVSIHKHCFSLSSASFESYQNLCFGQNYHCDKVWGL